MTRKSFQVHNVILNNLFNSIVRFKLNLLVYVGIILIFGRQPTIVRSINIRYLCSTILPQVTSVLITKKMVSVSVA